MNEPHPLFLPDGEDSDVPEVGYIHVFRSEHGRMVCAPPLFPAAELMSSQEIFELFGGGVYELVARDRLNRKITARRRLELPGKSRPLTGEQPPEPQQPPQSFTPPAQAASGDGAGALAIVMPFVQMIVQMSQQQAQQNNALMIAMVQGQSQSSQQHIQAMQALHDRQVSMMSEFARSMAETRTEGGLGQAMEAIQVGMNIVRGAQEGATEQAAGDSIAEFANGMGAVAEQLGKVKALVGDDPPAPAPGQKPRAIPAQQAPAPAQRPPQQPQQPPAQAAPKQAANQ